MTTLRIDDSLEIRFEVPWQARDWDKSKARREVGATQSKAVDVVATRSSPNQTLLVEIKDDRLLKGRAARAEARVHALAELAMEVGAKVAGTLGGLRRVSEKITDAAFYTRALRYWDHGLRRVIVWHEPHQAAWRAANTNSAQARAKKLLADLRNLIKRDPRFENAQVRVMSIASGGAPGSDFTVQSIAQGVASRRKNLKS
jgi:hypothetical protein